jgi:uncharacterized protein with NRDE domain
MCVLAFAWRAHAQWPLVAIANRDEFHARPAAPLARWENGIVAGRDLRSGGTWLGVGPSGRFAALTNLRSDVPPDPAAPSRGGLVTALLDGTADPADVALEGYSPFTLVCLDAAEGWLLTNRPEPTRIALERGLHGLTNGPFDRPWPKLAGLKAALADWLQSGANTEPLFAALADERVPEGAYDEATALPPFIRRPVYGTRCSTVVAVSEDGEGQVTERSFDVDGLVSGEAHEPFAWGR